MDLFIHSLEILIIVLGIINVLRMTILLIGSDLYSLRAHLHRKRQQPYQAKVSVIIPAYNEERSIVACIKSVLASDYPKKKLEVIVVNDGSTDNTERVLRTFVSTYAQHTIRCITQANKGKAHALNTGIQQHASGELIMCLDADSSIAPNAIANGVKYFTDNTVMALASNVKIIQGRGLLHLVQVFEYIISYQMKKSQTLFNIEYIIGGIGSMFRREYLRSINYYDVNTVTEDIDLTMKILSKGNKNVRVIYGSDVVTYTQAAVNLSGLLQQRYRWKWGRYQTFYKNRKMFFSSNPNYTKGFSWIYLPYTVFSDLTFLLEPLILGYMGYVIVFKQDLATLFSACIIITFYIIMNILAEETIPFRQKFRYILLAPCMYFLFFVLSYVEYAVLIRSLIHLPNIKRSLLRNTCSWNPIPRTGLNGA